MYARIIIFFYCSYFNIQSLSYADIVNSNQLTFSYLYNASLHDASYLNVEKYIGDLSAENCKNITIQSQDNSLSNIKICSGTRNNSSTTY